jgi:ribosomal protein S18 acetylase RimI-like enzyme
MPVEHQLTVRSLQPDDWVDVVGLDALLTGANKGAYWKQILESYLSDDSCLGLAAEVDGELAGYLFGELRAFEFGSELCGWVFSLGVQPGTTRQGVASGLLAKARDRFLELGVSRVRTMVHRTDVPLLALFRSQSFVGGPFVQLELDIAGDPVDPSMEGKT